MDCFELWGGISVSSTPEEIKKLYPEARGQNPIELCSLEICGCEFVASWQQTEDRNHIVQLDMARSLRHMVFKDLQQQLIALLSSKYGCGSAAIKYDNVYQKRWYRRFIRVQLTCVDDENLLTACIEYFRPLYLDSDKI